MVFPILQVMRTFVQAVLKRTRLLPWLRGRFQLAELGWLATGFLCCALLFVFVRLASEVMEGETQAIDVSIMRALRDRNDPSTLVGPPWLESAMLDLTALGSTTVLWLIVVSVVGFLLLQGIYRTALVLVVTAATAAILTTVMKSTFMRPRPEVVPHLRDVVSTSFPSGHALESAIVYLTMGAVLMRIAKGKLAKSYCLGIAALLTALVGVSRVYLGVHYPTDVLGGWTLGFAWALLCRLWAQLYDPEERAPSDAGNGKRRGNT
jgi:undecaprenyl-diphosphatase